MDSLSLMDSHIPDSQWLGLSIQKQPNLFMLIYSSVQYKAFLFERSRNTALNFI